MMSIPDILPGMAIVVKVYHLNVSCLTFCTMAILPKKRRIAIISYLMGEAVTLYKVNII